MFFCVCPSMFCRFLEGRNLKNINFASTGTVFLQNRLFQKNMKKSPIWAPFGEAKALENHVKSGQIRSRHFRSKKNRTGTFSSQFSRRQSEHPSYKEGSALENPSISYLCHYLGTFASNMKRILSKMERILSITLGLGVLGALVALLGRSWTFLERSWNALGAS